MNKHPLQQIPRLKNLPISLPNENAVRLESEQGILIFRASSETQKRIEELLEKHQSGSLSASESEELEAFGEIDDYLGYVNRLIRNSFELSEVNLAA